MPSNNYLNGPAATGTETSIESQNKASKVVEMATNSDGPEGIQLSRTQSSQSPALNVSLETSVQTSMPKGEIISSTPERYQLQDIPKAPCDAANDSNIYITNTHESSIVRIATPSPLLDNGGGKNRIPDVQSPSRKSESIRARLRSQEQRLTSLMSTRRLEVTDAVESEMRNVREHLDHVEAEKAALEQKLEYLQLQQAEDEAKRLEEGNFQHFLDGPQLEDIQLNNTAEHQEFLRMKLSGIQKGFDEQANKIESLNDIINHKNYEINQLQLELETKIKLIIELEYELQSHSIHYTNYSQQQFQLGNDAMQEINELVQLQEIQQSVRKEKNEDDDVSGASPLTLPAPPNDNNHSTCSTWITLPGEKNNSNGATSGALKKNPQRAKKLISTLRTDMDHLEELYKSEKLKSMELVAKLSKENEELRAVQVVLERERKEQQAADKKSMLEQFRRKKDVNEVNVDVLRKRIDLLEAVRFIYRKELLRLQSELNRVTEVAENDARKHKVEIARLNITLETLRKRCSTLEQDLFESADLSASENMEQQRQNSAESIASSIQSSEYYVYVQSDDTKHGRNKKSKELEQRMIDCHNEMNRLEAELEIKDKQIFAMKKEIHEFRRKDIMNGGGDPSLYSDVDVSVLQTIDKKAQRMSTILFVDRGQRQAAIAKDQSSTEDTVSTTSMEQYDDDPLICNLQVKGRSVTDLSSDAMNSYVVDLQKQLNEVRIELAKKEQELFIEKARSSCMAANLLDRIEAFDHIFDDDDGETVLTTTAETEIQEGTNEDEDDDGNVSLQGNSGSQQFRTNRDQTKPSTASQLDHPQQIDTKATNVKEKVKKNNGDKKERKKIFGRIPLRFYL